MVGSVLSALHKKKCLINLRNIKGRHKVDGDVLILIISLVGTSFKKYSIFIYVNN